MDDKTKGLINNVFTVLGGALLLYPLIDEAAKTIIPEMQKLTSGDVVEQLKALPAAQEKQPTEKEERPERPEHPEHPERREHPMREEDQEQDDRNRREC